MANYTFHSQKAAAIKRVEAATKGKLREFILTMQRKAKQKSPVLTGNNRRSISFDMQGQKRARVYTESGYGGFLELGTARRAATPYFAPAFKETKDTIAKGKWDE